MAVAGRCHKCSGSPVSWLRPPHLNCDRSPMDHERPDLNSGRSDPACACSIRRRQPLRSNAVAFIESWSSWVVAPCVRAKWRSRRLTFGFGHGVLNSTILVRFRLKQKSRYISSLFRGCASSKSWSRICYQNTLIEPEGRNDRTNRAGWTTCAAVVGEVPCLHHCGAQARAPFDSGFPLWSSFNQKIERTRSRRRDFDGSWCRGDRIHF